MTNKLLRTCKFLVALLPIACLAVSAHAADGAFASCIERSNANCSSLPSSQLANPLEVLCEAKLKEMRCDQLKNSSSVEDQKKFVSCKNPQTLCELSNPNLGAKLYSCGSGAGGVLIDAAVGTLLLPISLYKIAEKVPDLPGILRKCSSDDEAKIAYMGTLRPTEMTADTIRNMSCGDIQKFIEMKINVLLQRIESKRQDEMIKQSRDDLSPFDLKLSDQEIQALNFDTQHSGILRKSQCFSAADAAAVACGELTKVAIGVAGVSGAIKLVRVLGADSEVIAGMTKTSPKATEGLKIKSISNSEIITENDPRTANAVDSIFKGNKSTPELARLDAIISKDVDSATAKMTPKQKENFLHALENSKSGITGVNGDSGDLVGLNNAGAHVNIDSKTGLTLAVDIFAKQHPLGRLYLRHELSHLSRFVSEADNAKDAAKFANNVVTKRSKGIYREEVGSFRDQYRFLHKAYQPSDIPKLKESMPGPNSADIEVLLKEGILVKLPNGGEKLSIDIGKGFKAKDENQQAFFRYMTGNMNEIYLKDLEAAMSKSESEYIKNWIGPSYRDQQKQISRNEGIQQALRYIMWGAPAAAGATAAYLQYKN